MRGKRDPALVFVFIWSGVVLAGMVLRFYLAWNTPLNEDELRNWVGIARLGTEISLWPVFFFTTINPVLYYIGAAFYWLLGPREDLLWLMRLFWVLLLVPAGFAYHRIAKLILGRPAAYAALAVTTAFSYLLWKTCEVRQVLPAVVFALIGLWLAVEMYVGNRQDRPGRFFFTGAVLGLAVFNHYDSAIVGLTIGLYEVGLLIRGQRSFAPFLARMAAMGLGAFITFMAGPVSYGFPHGTLTIMQGMFGTGLSFVANAPIRVPGVFDTFKYDAIAWTVSIIGLVAFWLGPGRKRESRGAGLLLVFTLLSPIQIIGRTEVWEHTFITPMIAAGLWAGWLLARMARSWPGALISLVLLAAMCSTGPRLVVNRLGELKSNNISYHDLMAEDYPKGRRGPFTLEQLRDMTDSDRDAKRSPFMFFVPYSKSDQIRLVAWSRDNFDARDWAWDGTGYAPYLRPPILYQHSFYMNTVEWVDHCMVTTATELKKPGLDLPHFDPVREMQHIDGQSLMVLQLTNYPPDLVLYDRYAVDLLNAWPEVAKILSNGYRYYVLPGPDFFVGVRSDNDPFQGRSP